MFPKLLVKAETLRMRIAFMDYAASLLSFESWTCLTQDADSVVAAAYSWVTNGAFNMVDGELPEYKHSAITS